MNNSNIKKCALCNQLLTIFDSDIVYVELEDDEIFYYHKECFHKVAKINNLFLDKI